MSEENPPSDPKMRLETCDDVFAVAVELPESERSAYLDEVCTDSGQRKRIEQMLEAAGEAEEFFGDFGPPSAPPSIERPGASIGRYKLLQQIGEGGFGTIFMAEQREPITRRVALKVIKAGMDTQGVIARFEAERQALAMMDHPNIAKVFDAGSTPSGRPYFVMELVKGVPITRFCNEQKLDTDQRLELFLDICAAVNHAHQKGIIHRDLKPANILVSLHGDRPVPKIIDFGIAKATEQRLTEKTLFTRFEQMVGTPLYMSPEQADSSGLDVDTRTDIYALGVILYELLAGKPPFDGSTLLAAGYDEMRRIIRDQEPPKPSTRLSTLQGNERTMVATTHRTDVSSLGRLIRGDLDWIVMKAIEKDRTRRYETANGFALDISRHLNEELVAASPPSVGYKLHKFARRNKGLLGAAAAVLLALVAGTVVSSWQAWRATAAEALAKERLAEVESERNKARVAREEAVEVSKFLTGLLQSPDPARDGRKVTVVELLDKATGDLERLAGQTERRASFEMILGETYKELGLYQEAIELLEASRARFADHFDDEYHPRSLDAAVALAGTFSKAGRRAEAMQLQKELYEFAKAELGDDDPDTWRAATNYAGVLLAMDRAEDALELQKWALTRKEQELGLEDVDTWKAMMTLANILDEMGSAEQALDYRQRAYDLSRANRGPQHPLTLGNQLNLAISFGNIGEREKAEAIYSELIPICEEVFGRDHHITLKAMTNHANILSELGEHARANALESETLARKVKVLPKDHPDTIRARIVQARIFERAGEWEQAIEAREELMPGAKVAFGEHDRITIDLRASLGWARLQVGDPAAALTELEEALNDAETHLDEADPVTIKCLAMLSDIYAQLDRDEEAIAKLSRALELSQSGHDPTSEQSLGLQTNLGLLLKKTGRTGDAVLTLRENLGGWEKLAKPGAKPDLRYLGSMTNLATALVATGETAEARELLEESVKLKREHYPRHKFLKIALGNLAQLVFEAGDYRRAIELAREYKDRGGCCPGCETADKVEALLHRARQEVSTAE